MSVEVEKDAGNVANALIQTQGNDLVLKVLQGRMDEIQERKTRLEARKSALLDDIESRVITDEEIAAMAQYSEAVMAGLADPTPEMKRGWLERLNASVIVEKGMAIVECVLGTSPILSMKLRNHHR